MRAILACSIAIWLMVGAESLAPDAPSIAFTAMSLPWLGLRQCFYSGDEL